MKGSYALRLWLPMGRRLTVGKLGTFEFPKGEYLYFGSALNGLEGRIHRHFRTDKKRHWHIDYLTEVTSIFGVWWTISTERKECSLARAALEFKTAMIPARGFGASDCRCQSHLVYLATDPAASEATTGQPTSESQGFVIGEDRLEWRKPPANPDIALSLWE